MISNTFPEKIFPFKQSRNPRCWGIWSCLDSNHEGKPLKCVVSIQDAGLAHQQPHYGKIDQLSDYLVHALLSLKMCLYLHDPRLCLSNMFIITSHAEYSANSPHSLHHCFPSLIGSTIFLLPQIIPTTTEACSCSSYLACGRQIIPYSWQ